jgi:hypothetical protein
MGEYSETGWWTYFPIALAIKTPLATQLLVLAGIAALLTRRVRSRRTTLFVRVVVFAGARSAPQLPEVDDEDGCVAAGCRAGRRCGAT